MLQNTQFVLIPEIELGTIGDTWMCVCGDQESVCVFVCVIETERVPVCVCFRDPQRLLTPASIGIPARRNLEESW